MVEHRRAAGEGELGEADARGGVFGLLVDGRPDRVESLEPAEEVLLLRPRSREVLPQVVVRVHQPRSHNRSAEILHLIGVGLRACAGVLHKAVVKQDPAAFVFGPCVVHRHDVGVGEQHAQIFSGTIWKRSTSTSPRSVIFRLGITDRPRNDSVRNGVAPDQPTARAALLHARLFAITAASGASASSPATGSGSSAFTSPPSTTTMPPPSSPSRSTALVMSSSSIPTTTMLCASCATVDASAPRCSPEPWTNPWPIRPVPRWRSMTAIFARSLPGSATAKPFMVVGSTATDLVTTWSGTSPIARALPPSQGIARSAELTGRLRTECLTHSGTSGSGISSTGRPAFSVSSGSNRFRSGRSSRSAW